MNLFISSDIEGTCGIAAWSETEPGRPDGDYAYFKQQMSREVAAACRGALAAGGVERILVKDAHDSARNIDPSVLPEEVQINRGWAGDVYSMMSGIQHGDWDAAVFTGYHAAACCDGNPLSHTMNTSVDYVEINGVRASRTHAQRLYGGLSRRAGVLCFRRCGAVRQCTAHDTRYRHGARRSGGPETLPPACIRRWPSSASRKRCAPSWRAARTVPASCPCLRSLRSSSAIRNTGRPTAAASTRAWNRWTKKRCASPVWIIWTPCACFSSCCKAPAAQSRGGKRSMTQKERMLAGLPYKAWMDGLPEERARAQRACWEFNRLPPDARAEQHGAAARPVRQNGRASAHRGAVPLRPRLQH